MTIISALKTFLTGYSGLSSAPLWVDYLGASVPEVSVVTLPGTKVLAHYIHGGSRRMFPFALQLKAATTDDAARLENSGFFEGFSDWLDQQTVAGTLPALGDGKTALAVGAEVAFLFEQGQSGTGIYQIQCWLEYEQAPAAAPAEEEED